LFNGIMHEKDIIKVFILEKYCKICLKCLICLKNFLVN